MLRPITTAVASLLTVSACTFGVDHEFDVEDVSNLTSADADPLFELTYVAGEEDLPLEFFRVEFHDVKLQGGLYAQGDSGDVHLELAVDEGLPGIVEPGDVLRAYEDMGEGFPFDSNMSGDDMAFTILVLAPSQREDSRALLKSWQGVDFVEWTVGQRRNTTVPSTRSP